jgi:hypothetical protein
MRKGRAKETWIFSFDEKRDQEGRTGPRLVFPKSSMQGTQRRLDNSRENLGVTPEELRGLLGCCV